MPKSRSRTPFSWKQEIGGVPVWGIGVAAVAILGMLAVPAVVSATTPAAVPYVRPTDAFDDPAPDAFQTLSVAVVGDSFTGGSGMDSGEGYRWRDLIDGYEVTSLHEGGTGYATTRETDAGPSNFVTRVQSIPEGAERVVFFGSVNDSLAGYDATYAAAATAFADTAARAPGAEVLVIGPASPVWPVTAEMTAARDAVRDAATAAGLTFFDPIDAGWFSGNPEFIGADGTHPNDAGHAYLAEQIAAVLDANLR